MTTSYRRLLRPGCRNTAFSLQAVSMLFPLLGILFYLLRPQPPPHHWASSLFFEVIAERLLPPGTSLDLSGEGVPSELPQPLAFPDSSMHHTVIKLLDFSSPTPDSESGRNKDGVSVLITTEFPERGRKLTHGRCLINVCHQKRKRMNK